MSGRIIRTVTGDIKPEELGFCNNHTHTVINARHMLDLVGYMVTDDYDALQRELKEFRDAGGDALVECSTVGEGRPTNDIVRMSEESGVKIIASTGFHIPLFYPAGHWCMSLSEQELSDIFIDEITKGMYTDCDESLPEKMISAKAGIIKVACTNKVFKEVDERRFRAAVNASVETGAALHCHTDFMRKNALLCAEKMIEMGASPDRIIIAHTDVYPYEGGGVHEKLADMGVWLDFDSFMNGKAVCDRAAQIGAVINLVMEMVKKGYTKQIMIGDDMLSYGLHAFGGDGMAFVPTILRRWLGYAGLSARDDEQIFMKNPAIANSIVIK